MRKSLGQHFLRDRNILQRIVDGLRLTGGETVIEIGPGRGALSDLLLPLASRLVLIEYDRALAKLLQARYAQFAGVTVLCRDVLDLQLGEVAGSESFVVIGNIPYNLTTPILFHALAQPRPMRSVFLVQREVAERIVAEPNTSAYGALSVNIQALTEPTLLFRVKAGAFDPPPKVESAVVRLEATEHPVVSRDEEEAYSRFVQQAFGQRRKQLRRVLRSVLDWPAAQVERLLAAAQVSPSARPETLSPRDFARLFRAARDGSATLTHDLPARS